MDKDMCYNIAASSEYSYSYSYTNNIITNTRLWLITLLLLHSHTITITDTADFQDSILDGVSLNYQEFGNPNGGIGDIPSSSNIKDNEGILTFTPPSLSFGSRPLGVPHTEKVILTNKSNKTVHLSSISGSTMHFHSSFFEDKIIPPNGNTSFNVVFLGRERGHVDTNLFIHTSEGIHKYTMSGVSVPSAYRLQPLVGVKLPHNASFAPLIYMHNPHDHPIQITEVYSSGGGVVLELPGGGIEGPQALWRVPPHATRPIITVRYHESQQQSMESSASSRSNHPHIAYVRIKVNGTQSVLVVAVEVFPSTEPGPYTSPHFIDFGMGGTKDPPKQVNVYMGNSSPRPVRLTSISVRAADGVAGGTTLGGGVRATLTNRLTLPPFSPPNVHVATLTIDWKEAYESMQCCGKIVIRTKHGQYKVVLPYVSHVLNGGVTFDENIPRYLTSDLKITDVRQFHVKNEYKISVYLTELVISPEIQKHFEITDFWPKIVEPNETTVAFKIRLKNWSDSLKFESKLLLHTNISTLEIPVFIYNGKLDLTLSIKPQASKPKDLLDFGLVGTSSTSRALIFFFNPNPAPVCLKAFGADLPGGGIQLVGCVHIPFGYTSHPTNLTGCNCVAPTWSAVYSISVVAPIRETTIRGEVWMTTFHEKRILPVSYSAVDGGRLLVVDPDMTVDCFPGTICSRPLSIKSTFPVDMDIISFELVPQDPRLSHVSLVQPTTILARSVSDVGWLNFDGYKKCEDRCYTGFDLNTTVGAQWLSRVSLPIDTLILDTQMFEQRHKIFKTLPTGKSFTNLAVKMETNQVRNYRFVTKLNYIWPYLYSGPDKVLDSSLAQLGQTSEMKLTFANPSKSRPVFVQLYLDWMSGVNTTSTTIKIHFKPSCPLNKPCNVVSEKLFYFKTCKLDNLDDVACGGCEVDVMTALPKSWVSGYPTPHPDTCIFTLPPGGEKNITVIFAALMPAKFSSLLYIRNNLTALEVLRLSGHGVIPSLKFGNRKPGSTSPLLFELTEKHLKDCTKDKATKTNLPNLTVRRSFVARNTGDIPITISKFLISGSECEGYGFRVLNCESIELLPNATHKVDIAFTPDFTLTKVERTLILETSLSIEVNYTLISSIPVSLMGKCAAVLKRPSWESSLRSTALSFLTCIAICVLIAGFNDSDRILKIAFLALSRDRAVVHPPLDLRSIGQMGMNKKPESYDCCVPNTTTDKKSKEAPSWNFEDRSFTPDDMKSPNKYEEPNQLFGKSKKKLTKRGSNPVESSPIELVAEQEIPQQKEKRNEKNKNLFHDPWKLGNVMMRNGSVNLKLSKNNSQGNSSSDSSETSKVSSPNTPELINDKHTKPADITKKALNEFNIGEESRSRNHSNQTKKHKQKCHSHSHSINNCEEDTSSTTTESSNNDDVEKENDNSTSSSSGKSVHALTTNKKSTSGNISKKAKSSVQYRDSYEGDGEDEEFDHKAQTTHSPVRVNESHHRWTKNRENVVVPPLKNISESEKPKQYESNKGNNHSANENSNAKPNKKETNKSNPKKDKLPLSKKRSLDKSFVFSGKTESNPPPISPGFNAARSSPSTPPAISTVWENKASFSDVVARSDNSLYANNFTTQVPKEPETIRKVDHKIASVNQSHPSNILPSPMINNPKPNIDLRSSETHRRTPSDLGPIGSTNFMKKSPTQWTENYAENPMRHYNTVSNASNVDPIKKPQAKKVNDLNTNSNNSFFMSSNSNSYFSTNNFSDITNPLRINTNNIANSNTFGSTIAANVNNPNSINTPPILRQQNIITQQNDNRGLCNRDINTNRDSFLKRSAHSGMLDMNPNERINSLNDQMQMQGMDPYDSRMQWQRNPNPENENVFEVDYNNMNMYTDNIGWSGTTSLWDQPSGGHNPQDSHPSSIQLPSTNNSALGTNDRGPAEWLWGYDNGNSNNNVGGLGAIGSAPRPPPGLNSSQSRMQLNTPNQFSQQQQQHQQQIQQQKQQQQQQQQQQQSQQPQVVRAFDPFLSLSSIWSPGSALDRWANQQNKDGNKDQNNSRSNQYQ